MGGFNTFKEIENCLKFALDLKGMIEPLLEALIEVGAFKRDSDGADPIPIK